MNLDYAHSSVATVVGPGNLEVFETATRTWSPAKANRAELDLSPGGGKLVREARVVTKLGECSGGNRQ